MESLADLMKKVLADSFAFYLKAQYFHWNVESDNFPMWHEFFGKIYEEVYGSVDSIAEHVRAINEYAPGSFKRFAELSSIKDQTGIPSAEAMVAELYSDNRIVLQTLMSAYKAAEQRGEIGLSNFIQDRYDAHKKHEWMLRATMARQEK